MTHSVVEQRWSDLKITYPWELSTFSGGREEMQSIMEHFRKLKYPFAKYKKQPEERMLNAISKIMPLILNREWVFVLTNNSYLMQSIAEVIPMCFILTALDPCRNISTAYLMNLLTSKNGMDDWIKDFTADSYPVIVKTGLLVWESITESSGKSLSYGSKFMDLLTARKAMNYPMMFTAIYSGIFTDKVLVQIHRKMDGAIGESASIKIRQEAKTLHFKSSKSEGSLETFQA